MFLIKINGVRKINMNTIKMIYIFFGFGYVGALIWWAFLIGELAPIVAMYPIVISLIYIFLLVKSMDVRHVLKSPMPIRYTPNKILFFTTLVFTALIIYLLLSSSINRYYLILYAFGLVEYLFMYMR